MAVEGVEAGPGGPVPVVVSLAAKRDLPVYLGRPRNGYCSPATVMVNSRVAGELTEVDFKEGQDIQKGDLLAVIDPRPYQVALAQAEAALAKDQAGLKDAKLNQQRYFQLAKEGVIPQQQSDTQGATVDQLSGSVAGDQAHIDSAKLNLVYSHITAPVSGRVGLRLVDPGNVIGATTNNTTGTTTGLLMITQMHPITVIFTLPEDSLNSVVEGMRHGTLVVKAMSRDAGTELATGKLLTVDNTIDPTTGTFKLRAEFENKDEKLWPNQFVNARLQLRVEKDALVVPYSAIQTGGQGSFVYVVSPSKTVEARNITVGVTEGNVSSIAKGLNVGDQVVVDGQDRLRAGMQVDPRADRGDGGAALAPASADASGNGGGGRGGRGGGADRGNGGDRAQRAGDATTGGYRKGGKDGAGQSRGSAEGDPPCRAGAIPKAQVLSHESVSNFHPPAGRHFAFYGGHSAGRDRRLPPVAGIGASPGRLSDHPGADLLSGCRPLGDRDVHHRSARKGISARSRD